MNPVERVLYDEITRLLDRLAVSVPDTSFDAIRAANPTLRARLEEAEATLAAQRAGLLEGYGRGGRGARGEGGGAGLEAPPVVGQRPRERHLDGDEPRGLVRRGASGGLDARGLLGREVPRHARLEVGEERAHARLVLRAVARAVGVERGQPPRAPALDQRPEAHEVQRRLQALAQLGLDPRREIHGLHYSSAKMAA